VRANSSTRIAEHGVIADRVDAYRHALDPETAARIEELAGDLYARAAALSSSG
jgi:hypothetical protein